MCTRGVRGRDDVDMDLWWWCSNVLFVEGGICLCGLGFTSFLDLYIITKMLTRGVHGNELRWKFGLGSADWYHLDGGSLEVPESHLRVERTPANFSRMDWMSAAVIGCGVADMMMLLGLCSADWYHLDGGSLEVPESHLRVERTPANFSRMDWMSAAVIGCGVADMMMLLGLCSADWYHLDGGSLEVPESHLRVERTPVDVASGHWHAV